MQASIIQKYKGKGVAGLIGIAQKHFNKWIRERDLDHNEMFKCISCGKFKSKRQMHAGHFYSAGHHGALRFDEDNVHGQCSHCNTFLHGNLIEYRKRLELKIGKERLERLDQISKSIFKHDRIKLIEIIEKYK